MNKRLDVAEASLKLVLVLAGTFGLLSLLKGCSPEWSGGEGGAAVGGAFQAIGFVLYGLILLGVGGMVLFLFQLVRRGRPSVVKGAGWVSIGLGLCVGMCPLVSQNPFTRSNSAWLYQIPDGAVSWGIGIGLLVMGIAAVVKRQNQA